MSDYIFFAIYFSGYLTNYFYLKVAAKNHHPESYDWSDVIFRIVMSIGSWVAFIGCFMLVSCLWDGPLGKETSKPPKWL